MTPQELRERRALVIYDYSDATIEMDECQTRLEAIDAEQADSNRKPEVAFYTHLNTLDADMRAYVGTQGDTAAELRLIETIQKHLTARAGQLEGK